MTGRPELPGELRSAAAHERAGTAPGEPFEIGYGQARIPALPGETFGAALTAAGVRSWRRTRFGGRPRGLFCGIGACFDCLLPVNGGPPVRACLTEAAPGDTAAPPEAPLPRPAAPPPADDPGPPRGYDVAVVGAGPAGLAAALAAADRGQRVVLVDAGARPGGQYHRQPPRPFGARRPEALQPDGTARAAEAALTAHPLVTLHSGESVWAAEPAADGFTLHLTGGGAVRVRAVVVATGAHDLALPFPGWDLPGVFTAGGAQALVKGQLTLPGRRVVVAGTGPLLLPVAATLAEAGATVLGVFDANHPARWLRRLPAALGHAGRLREAAHYLRILRRHRIPVRYRRAVVAAHGGSGVEAVTLARLAPDWTPLPGARHRRRLAADAVAVGFGFVAGVELPLALGCATVPDPAGLPVVVTDHSGRTSVAGVYAAGEVTGVGGARLAAVEGELAGRAVAADLAATGPAPATGADARLRRRRARLRRFAAALAEVYPVRPGWRGWLDGDTLVCRCEEVPLSRIRHAVEDLAATEPRAVKLTTRAGMGMCQGRICGPALATLLAAGSGAGPGVDATPLAGRPIVAPVPLGTVAAAARPPDPGRGDHGLDSPAR
ncbi:FAD-dependent oxidoreductase [Phytohabitans sp. ZYX-F-186]|uniref:FAD-dependent oxidoreductase n=1 Tax=Phytohabitans maris TaxID=3071409 RepID=A0ABU0ZN64_9ACTN|nr:FAD-dependent oxidoreductase [Phytohabitans sp. ZYX-F-186]MDQ7908491.1 FAD-dependent oxidoreductase [Phytohabitans sp. ZYX-F-186]